MSKFFVQLLLSVIVSVSAAVGFNPHAREKLHETWREAKALVRETTQAAFETVSGVEVNTEASTEASVETDVDAEAFADTDTEAGVELEADAEIETEAEAEFHDAVLELESEIESEPDLNLGFDK
ncbi:MAG TPA: hypothetical protein VFR47_06960 [Anaerolineales bacterium]|nr:hypothetical protein [Anaerolineales bacterium]